MKERHELEPLVHDWLHQTLDTIPDPTHRYGLIAAEVNETDQERGWLPRFDTGGFAMFSALKFIAAGVIVALFGGFLLAGVLTTQQSDEPFSAAVTESPEPEVTSDTTEASTTSVRSDILPGVTLTVEEVEPGVFRVIDDGVRDLAKANNLDIVAGHDGGVWLLRPQRFFRLGDDAWRAWPTEKPEGIDFGVAPDGTVWALSDGGLYSVGGGSDDWMLTKGRALIFEVTSDGTVWALWLVDAEGPDSRVFGYLGGDGWQSVGELPPEFAGFGWGELLVSDRGEVWAVDNYARRSRDLQHFVDAAWRTYDGLDLRGPLHDSSTAVGADGTLWGRTSDAFFRFDGSGWRTFAGPDWMPDGSLTDLGVAPDGSVWVGHRHTDSACGGVGHFDGETWSRYVQGRCVEAMDIASGGAVWLLDEEGGLYVITPEAVAATE